MTAIKHEKEEKQVVGRQNRISGQLSSVKAPSTCLPVSLRTPTSFMWQVAEDFESVPQFLPELLTMLLREHKRKYFGYKLEKSS